jgi:hypothetical protein
MLDNRYRQCLTNLSPRVSLNIVTVAKLHLREAGEVTDEGRIYVSQAPQRRYFVLRSLVNNLINFAFNPKSIICYYAFRKERRTRGKRSILLPFSLEPSAFYSAVQKLEN